MFGFEHTHSANAVQALAPAVGYLAVYFLVWLYISVRESFEIAERRKLALLEDAAIIASVNAADSNVQLTDLNSGTQTSTTRGGQSAQLEVVREEEERSHKLEQIRKQLTHLNHAAPKLDDNKSASLRSGTPKPHLIPQPSGSSDSRGTAVMMDHLNPQSHLSRISEGDDQSETLHSGALSNRDESESTRDTSDDPTPMETSSKGKKVRDASSVTVKKRLSDSQLGVQKIQLPQISHSQKSEVSPMASPFTDDGSAITTVTNSVGKMDTPPDDSSSLKPTMAIGTVESIHFPTPVPDSLTSKMELKTHVPSPLESSMSIGMVDGDFAEAISEDDHASETVALMKLRMEPAGSASSSSNDTISSKPSESGERKKQQLKVLTSAANNLELKKSPVSEQKSLSELSMYADEEDEEEDMSLDDENIDVEMVALRRPPKVVITEVGKSSGRQSRRSSMVPRPIIKPSTSDSGSETPDKDSPAPSHSLRKKESFSLGPLNSIFSVMATSGSTSMLKNRLSLASAPTASMSAASATAQSAATSTSGSTVTSAAGTPVGTTKSGTPSTSPMNTPVPVGMAMRIVRAMGSGTDLHSTTQQNKSQKRKSTSLSSNHNTHVSSEQTTKSTPTVTLSSSSAAAGAAASASSSSAVSLNGTKVTVAESVAAEPQVITLQTMGTDRRKKNETREFAKSESLFTIWLKLLFAKRLVYQVLLIHVLNTTSDFGTLLLWRRLAVLEEKKKVQISETDMPSMTFCILFIFVFYRMVSGFLIFRMTHDYWDLVYQFFDLKLFYAAYISSSTDPHWSHQRINAAIIPSRPMRWIRKMHAIFQAFPSAVLHLVFLIRGDKFYLWIGFGLTNSLMSIAFRLISDDSFVSIDLNDQANRHYQSHSNQLGVMRDGHSMNGPGEYDDSNNTISFCEKWYYVVSDSVKRWTEPNYLQRILFRLTELSCRILSVTLFWVALGGYVFSMVFALEVALMLIVLYYRHLLHGSEVYPDHFFFLIFVNLNGETLFQTLMQIIIRTVETGVLFLLVVIFVSFEFNCVPYERICSQARVRQEQILDTHTRLLIPLTMCLWLCIPLLFAMIVPFLNFKSLNKSINQRMIDTPQGKLYLNYHSISSYHQSKWMINGWKMKKTSRFLYDPNTGSRRLRRVQQQRGNNANSNGNSELSESYNIHGALSLINSPLINELAYTNGNQNLNDQFDLTSTLAPTEVVFSKAPRKLTQIVRNEKFAVLLDFLEFGADPNCIDTKENGLTPLHIAARKGKLKSGLALIVAGSFVNSQCATYDRTPMHEAVLNSRLSFVKLLLKTEANVNERDKFGRTPLHYACIYGDKAMVELLLNFEANPFIQDLNHNFPIDLAREFDQMENVELIETFIHQLKTSAEMLRKTHERNTLPLSNHDDHYAADENGDAEGITGDARSVSMAARSAMESFMMDHKETENTREEGETSRIVGQSADAHSSDGIIPGVSQASLSEARAQQSLDKVPDFVQYESNTSRTANVIGTPVVMDSYHVSGMNQSNSQSETIIVSSSKRSAGSKAEMMVGSERRNERASMTGIFPDTSADLMEQHVRIEGPSILVEDEKFDSDGDSEQSGKVGMFEQMDSEGFVTLASADRDLMGASSDEESSRGGDAAAEPSALSVPRSTALSSPKDETPLIVDDYSASFNTNTT